LSSGAEREDIVSAAHHYGFLATIEVTNAINGNLIHKISQTELSAEYLGGMVGKRHVGMGLSYRSFKKGEHGISDINFVLQIKQYDPELLEGIFRSGAHSSPVWLNFNDEFREKADALFSGFLSASNAEQESLSTLLEKFPRNAPTLDQYLSLPVENYTRITSTVKGVVSELYVAEMFKKTLPECAVFQRVQVYDGDQPRGKRVKTDADVVVATEKREFYGMLDSLGYEDNGIAVEVFTIRSLL